MTAITAAVVATPFPHVRLSVTGAPTPPVNAYTSNFATVDGWSLTSGPSGAGVGVSLFPGLLTPKGAPQNTTPTIVSRTLTGLTVGAQYRYRALNPAGYARNGRFLIRVRATTGGADVATTAWVQPYNSSQDYTAELVFTATATTMVIQIGIVVDPAGYAAQYSFSSITVQPAGSWTPPELHRTDVNGDDVILDLYSGGSPEPTTASYVIDDWDAARTGEIQYALVDGLRAVANTSLDVTAALAGTDPILLDTLTVNRLNPAAPNVIGVRVLDYDATRDYNGSVHTIIGRSDKVANPGPLMLRSGRLELLADDYATALLVEGQVEAGRTLLLAQPDYPGMDMRFIGQGVTVRPAEAVAGPRPWRVSLTFDEVSG
ncbi:MAG TPA: hypothetical protein VF140_04710 [Phycicoccus sp.]